MTKTRGIYKRGNIYWIRYAGPDGRIRRESTGGGSIRYAQNMLIQRKALVLEGNDPTAFKNSTKYLFNDLAKPYLDWCTRQKAYKTKRVIMRQLVDYFGNIPLNRINIMMVEGYQSKGLEEGKRPATVNRHVTVLKHMFTKAVEWDMVPGEMLGRIRRVKNLRERNTRLRFLSKEECQILIDNCAPHLRPIVITALNTGLRKEEILSLKWTKNIDLRNGFINLLDTKNGERREVPINKTLQRALNGIIRRIDSPYVFIDKNGKRFGNVRKSFESALKRSKIEEFRFHDLRHTFASQLVMAGVDITTVKVLLGHKSLSMTMRYAHLAPSHITRAVNVLDKIANKNVTAQKLHNTGKRGT